MNLSNCYGPGLGDLVQLVGDVDVLSKQSINGFAADQWRRIGKVLDFSAELEPGLRGSLISGGQLGSIIGVGSAALAKHLHKRQGKEQAPPAFAQARYEVIHKASSDQRGWVLNIDLDQIQNGGCIGGVRVIPAVNRATYFHPERNDSLTPRDCFWPTTYPVYIGTWPWVYGHALMDVPPSLSWRRTADTDPVILCAQLYAAAWTLAGNAAIDAQSVYAHYQYFLKATSPLIERLPKEATSPRSLYRSDSGLIRVYMGEPTTEHLYGPLGPLSVVAYNHILMSFAAFFRVRSEIMAHHKNLPANVKSILDQNPDPCVQELRKPAPPKQSEKPVLSL